ncbi:putative phage tail protein [Paenibacillus agilis]|uniref:DUF2313 domain-containing protein n=1 Tax=Paenibacillus agilis TaxID=3020863 RepID=A0A559IXB0_9BACL|nr:putative phage tail protein [Paenibacillus agilis]TVX92231.1 DUF2313 domain-containing protein [Paenibacillus agilis]
MTERAVRMIESAPTYYENSRVYTGLQQANADELGRVSNGNDDLSLQLRAATATWGLKYWEVRTGLPVDVVNDYETRRKKIQAKIRSKAPLRASRLESIAEAYTQQPVKVTVNIDAGIVTFNFEKSFITDQSFYEQIENIMHAHLGMEYRAVFTYGTVVELSTESYSVLNAVPFCGPLICGTWPKS